MIQENGQNEENTDSAVQTVDAVDQPNEVAVAEARQDENEADLEPSTTTNQDAAQDETNQHPAEFSDKGEVATDNIAPGKNSDANAANKISKDETVSAKTMPKEHREDSSQNEKNKDVIVELEAAVKREVNARKVWPETPLVDE